MIYLLYDSERVLGRISCSPNTIGQNANGSLYVEDTFTDYHPSELTIENGVIVLKSQSTLDSESNTEAWLDLRSTRNDLLASSDWTQFNDSPLTNAKKTEWATYRQSLRDLPTNTSDPANPVWPSQPE